jgi:putative RecB family exonuclease
MRLSISRLNMMLRCPKQYEHRYVDGIVAPPGVALIVGKGTHRANASDLLAKMDSGSLLSSDEVKAIAADATKREWEAQDVALDDDERAQGADAVKGEAVDRSVTLASLYHENIAPTVEPTGIEEPFTVQLPSVVHELTGYIDVNTATRIRDCKTTGKTPEAEAADKSLQLTGYIWADWERSGRTTMKTGALDHLVTLKKSAKAITQETTRTEEDFSRLHARLDIAAETINSGLFAPCDPGQWCCSPKWCGYWNHCEFGARGKARP